MHPFENTNNRYLSENTDQQHEEHTRKLQQKDDILKRLALKRQEEKSYLELSLRDKTIILLDSLYMRSITHQSEIESFLTKEEKKEMTALNQINLNNSADTHYDKDDERHVKLIRDQMTSITDIIVEKKGLIPLSNFNTSKVAMLEKLEKEFDEALKQNSKDESLYNEIGTQFMYLRQYKSAIRAFNEALKHDSHGWLTAHYCDIGICFSELGTENELLGSSEQAAYFYQQALIFYDKSIETDSKQADIYNSKASTLNQLNRNEEALKCQNKAIELDPDRAEYYYNRGNIYYDLDWQEQALADYNQAKSINPSEGKYHFNQGAALIKLGWHEDALTAFEEAQRYGYEDSYLHFQKGNVLKLLNRPKDALIAFEEAQKHDNVDPDLYDYIEQLKSSIRETPQIREALTQSIKDLATTIENHPSYKGFPTTDEAILMLCGYDGEKELSELSEDELLYLESTVNGTKNVLERHENQPDEELTDQYLTEIQQAFLPEKTIAGSVGNKTEVSGLRKIGIVVPLSSSDGSADIAYKEWRNQCEKWNSDSEHILHNIFMTNEEIAKENIELLNYPGATSIIVCDERKPEQLDKATNYIFKECNKDIKAVDIFFKEYDKDIQNDETLCIISRTENWTAKAQPLGDGNSRTTGFGTLPKLLLKHNQEQTMIEQKQTYIFKSRSTGVIYGAIRYGQLRLKYWRDPENSAIYQDLIKRNKFNKKEFEANFNEQRKKREENFNQLNKREKLSTTYAYKSFSVYEKMWEIKRKVNMITKKRIKDDKDGFYSFAKEIGEHIDNLFIDRNYSVESSMESMYKINTKLGGEYEDLKTAKHSDTLFSDLRILYEHIQKAIKNAKKKNIPDYISTSHDFETASKISSTSYKSKTSQHTGISQQIDISELSVTNNNPD